MDWMSERKIVEEEAYKVNIANMRAAGALMLQPGSGGWSIEYERGGEVCIHEVPVEENGRGELLFFPVTRTFVVAGPYGIERAITGVIAIRQS